MEGEEWFFFGGPLGPGPMDSKKMAQTDALPLGFCWGEKKNGKKRGEMVNLMMDEMEIP